MTSETSVTADMIEQDIVRTQNDISETVEELQQKLKPASLIRSAIGAKGGSTSDRLIETARSNPVAYGLIGIGAAMLLSGSKSAKQPPYGSNRSSTFGSGSWAAHDEDHDPHSHYMAYMDRVQREDDEAEEDFHRRHDQARSTYFAVERGAAEDESTFRSRLDAMVEGLKNSRSKIGKGTVKMKNNINGRLADYRDTAREKGRAAWERTGERYDNSPLIGGVIALAAGAVAGMLIPKTRVEQEKLGPITEAAKQKATEYKDMALNAANEKLDQQGGSASQPENAFAAV